MDENSSVLSQDAIDALLNSQPSDDAEEAAPVEEAVAPETVVEAAEPVTEPAQPAVVAAEPAPVVEVDPTPAAAVEPAPPIAAPVEPPSAPQPVVVNAPPPPGVTPPPGVVQAEPPAPAAAPAGGVTEEQVLMMAGEAAESSVAPLQGDIGLISGRVDALEAALKKIKTLEAEVVRLKANKAPGGLTIEMLKPLIDRVSALERGAKNSPLFNLYEKFTCSSCGTHGAAQARARCGVCGKEGWFGRKEPA